MLVREKELLVKVTDELDLYFLPKDFLDQHGNDWQFDELDDPELTLDILNNGDPHSSEFTDAWQEVLDRAYLPSNKGNWSLEMIDGDLYGVRTIKDRDTFNWDGLINKMDTEFQHSD